MLCSEHFNHSAKTQKIESKQRDSFSSTFIYSTQEFSHLFSCKDTVYEKSLASAILKKGKQYINESFNFDRLYKNRQDNWQVNQSPNQTEQKTKIPMISFQNPINIIIENVRNL